MCLPIRGSLYRRKLRGGQSAKRLIAVVEPMSKTPSKESGSCPEWLSFEKAVAEIIKSLDPKARVTHNQRLQDLTGEYRQFDVVARGTFAGNPILAVFECKDLRKPVGVKDVEAFVTKSRDVGANVTQIISKRGFTKPALTKAEQHGVGTLSLLPHDRLNPGISLGMRWFVERYRWVDNRVWLLRSPGQRPIGSFDPQTVKWRGHRVVDWWGRRLSRSMARNLRPRVVRYRLRFRKVRRLTIGATRRTVSGIEFSSSLHKEIRTRQVQLSGIGTLDWNSRTFTVAGPLTIAFSGQTSMSLLFGPRGNQPGGVGSRPTQREGGWLKIPPGKRAALPSARFDFDGWEVLDRELAPDAPVNLGARMTVSEQPFDPQAKLPDLAEL